MLRLPKDLALLERFACAFTRPTYDRFVFLCLSAIVTMGRRSVCRLLAAAPKLRSGHPASYHRFFSAAHWSLWTLGRVLAAMVLELIPPDQPVVMEVDDTVNQHRGRKVYGKGWHRDAVRSSHGRQTFVLGHRWVVLAVNVKLPLCKRPWALPVLVSLYRPPAKQRVNPEEQVRAYKDRCKANAAEQSGEQSAEQMPDCRLPLLRKRNKAGKLTARHKTPCLLARQMLAAFLHWFPERRFIVAGDWGFASHDLAWFCYRHRRRITLVARFLPDAVLFARPKAKPRGRRGPQGRKGKRLPSPQEALRRASDRRHAEVDWYGRGRRKVELLSSCGGWYRARGSGRACLVPLRWVWARELAKGQEAWFYSTDPTLAPEQIIELFAGRWAIEVTFQEVRAHLGWATTRQRCRQSVLRAAPCLLGLFSVVSLLYGRIAGQRKIKIESTPCWHKLDPTFADALATVRWVVWEEVILPRTAGRACAAKMPDRFKHLLLHHLSAAA